MDKKVLCIFFIVLFSFTSFSQGKARKSDDEPIIRISTELVQVDAVVTDKAGRIVKGLTKDDFTISDSGKKQQISFFEFVDTRTSKASAEAAAKTEPLPPSAGLTAAEVKRIFAFVIDDLTIRYEDLNDLRQMLINFVDQKMQPTDLVAIIRTVGGKGLLQQFTSDKELLHRAINSLTAISHPFSVFHNPRVEKMGRPELAGGGGTTQSSGEGALDLAGETVDIDDPLEDNTKALRAFLSLGTASFVIDGLKQVAGRKSMVLISGGLPILSMRSGTAPNVIANYLQDLTDRATRAGVVINTYDIRGLQAQAVASFEDTPGKSSLGGGTSGFGRQPDETLIGSRNPINTFENQQGLRVLAGDTGGIAILNKNNLNEGLDQILANSEAYYLLAYTPSEGKFNGDFHKLEIKVKGDYKVYSRRGYFAREDPPSAVATTKQEQMLAAVKSPFVRRDIDLDAMLLYKATATPDKGTLDIHLVIDPKKLHFESNNDKQQADFDVVGFVFDELGRLRGGFSETATPLLTREEYNLAIKGGLSYSANTIVPAGIYQIRVAVRDNKTGAIGTLSRIMEVPNLAKGRLAASTLTFGAVPANDLKATNPTAISASRRISRSQDLRYAAIVYNAKIQDGKPQIRTQMVISQNGQVIFKEAEELLTTGNKSSPLIKVGQLGLGGVKPGRYTLTLIITDLLADKKVQTLTRSMDFVVVP